jgi:predicted GNAT family N-acyltransferase
MSASKPTTKSRTSARVRVWVKATFRSGGGLVRRVRWGYTARACRQAIGRGGPCCVSESPVSTKLTYRIAERGEREKLLERRNTIFKADLGFVPDDGLDPFAHHLIAATSEGEIVAAFRLLGPDLRPFDFEEIYSLDNLVTGGRRPAMLGRLWVAPDYRVVRRSVAIHSGLLRLALRAAVELSITDYFLCTFTRLVNFYRAASFRDTGFIHRHPGWGPLHVMHLGVSSPSANSSGSIQP